MIGSVTSVFAGRYNQLLGKWGSGLNFRPTMLTGLTAWYDASDIASVTIGTGGVSNWADKSGLGSRDLAQATEASRPSYSAATKTLTFDGVNDFLKTAAFTLNQPTTVYFVGSQVSWIINRTLWDGNAGLSGALVQDVASPQLTAFAGTNIGFTGDLAVGSRGLVTVVFNGASSSLKINNNAAVTGSSGADNMGGFMIGGRGGINQFANITANEVAVYNVAHTADQQARFWQYASRKWGIS